MLKQIIAMIKYCTGSVFVGELWEFGLWGETHNLLQNYIFAMGMYNITDYIVSSMVIYGNLYDSSSILAP